MTNGIHNTGKEFMMDYIFGNESSVASVESGLYNDTVDDLSEASDLSDITTEPSGASYARQSASFGTNFTNSFDGQNWESKMDNVTFDLSDSTQELDSVFIIVNFDSDYAGDAGTPQDHLWFTRSLSQTILSSGVSSQRTVAQTTATIGGC